MNRAALFDPSLARPAIKNALIKLDPRVTLKNPVIFVVEIGSLITTCLFCSNLLSGESIDAFFSGQISLWLWLTLFFANFAEALAEGRGRVQAETFKKSRAEIQATIRLPDGKTVLMNSSQLKKGDLVIVKATEVIPADGVIIEGAASVDESAVTGESAPVIREAGGDRNTVMEGTTVLSDHIVLEVSINGGESFLDRMIGLVEGTARNKTPNEITLSILLSGLTLIFLLVIITLRPFAVYSQASVSTVSLVALLVCLIPTTTSGLLSTIRIAGMGRLAQQNVLALSARAVEAAGDIDVLILDKTGTITIGNRVAIELFPADGVLLKEFIQITAISTTGDRTSEGRSIATLVAQQGAQVTIPADSTVVPFSPETRMSGVNFAQTQIRKGSLDAIQSWLNPKAPHLAGSIPPSVLTRVEKISRQGGTPLVVARKDKEKTDCLGVIYLKDVVKPGIRDRFERIRAMGIKTVMVTGDNRLTAATIAQEAGVDDFFADAKPEDKLRLIQSYQAEGRRVAMSGDGTNDALALTQSDLGLVMNTGTQAAREAGNMIDLDSDPTKIIEIVEMSRQLLVTRGSLTTFCIVSDVAKYFAILPALFVSAVPALEALNIMRLSSPKSATLSAVIFNALILIFLTPLALKGVPYRPDPAVKILRRNLLVFGLGGITMPFVGIKLIDLAISGLFLHQKVYN